MKKQIILAASTLALVHNTIYAQPVSRPYPHNPIAQEIQQLVTNDNTKIQVALLLDTSNSMDGLIDQAKSRLWNIINTIASLKFKGQQPKVEIALYEYGNDNISAANNYVRIVSSFTTDLDLISEKLFALSTNGGQEYCGAVIQNSVSQLEWSHNPSALKFIYIAGNEPFNQGNVNYLKAIKDAVGKKIYVNTIYCGDSEEGRRTKWSDGAIKGNGKYFTINSDEKIRYIETPYDDRLDALNTKLNDTYIAYGAEGQRKKTAQATQDANAASVSKSYKAERTVSKSKKVYKNDSWDLVDKVAESPQAIESIADNDLPEEMKGKTIDEKKKILVAKEQERKSIQVEIESLSKQRESYIENENKKLNNANTDDLGTAINKSIMEVAKQNGYGVE